MKEKELKNCNFIKAVLMLLVVLDHSICFYGGGWFTVIKPLEINKSLIFISGFIGNFHVYSFTFISGYIYYYLKYEVGKYKTFNEFLLNKIKRLITPYIFCSIFWVIPITQVFYKYNSIELIKKYLLGYSPSQLWFLLMLFNVFIIFFFLSDFFKKMNICIGGGITVLFYCLGIIGGKLGLNIFQICRSLCFIQLFYLGFKFRQCRTDYIKQIPKLLYIFVYLLLFLCARYFSRNDLILFKIMELVIRDLLHIVGAVMTFFVLQSIANKIDFDNKKIIKILTSNFMIIYLFHQQLIYIILYKINGLVNSYISGFLNFSGAILISLVIAKFLKNFKITRILIGEK